MEVFVLDLWWRSHQSSAHKSTYFQILQCVLVRYTRTPNQILHGNKDWSGSKHLDEAESDLSLGSRSFLHRVNDQVRNRQKQSLMEKTVKSILWYGECPGPQHCKHLYSWGRITQAIHIPSKILKISRWNRCWTYLRHWCSNNQTRYMEWRHFNWENSSWKYLSLNGDEQVISLQRTKVYVFSDSVLCLGKMNENPQSNLAWEDRLTWFESSSEYRTLYNATREKPCRKERRKESSEESHSTVKTNDEFDCKGSLNSVIFCISKPGEEK